MHTATYVFYPLRRRLLRAASADDVILDRQTASALSVPPISEPRVSIMTPPLPVSPMPTPHLQGDMDEIVTSIVQNELMKQGLRLRTSLTLTYNTVSQKSVACLIFYNLKKLETMFVIFYALFIYP